MNLFLVTADRELITPALGTILNSVTRTSVLELAGERGMTSAQRQFSLDELRAACADGSVREVFASGTAVINPILGFKGQGFQVAVGDGQPGKVTTDLRHHILDIQFGRVADRRGWLHRVAQP